MFTCTYLECLLSARRSYRMMATWLLISVAFLSIFAWHFLQKKKTARSLTNGKPVPGSRGWPILGHLPFLTPSDQFPLAHYYTEKYGPIFRLRYGEIETVLLTDYGLIKRAFSELNFAARPQFLVHEILSEGYQGILWSSGPLWREHRSFALRQLRELGMGTSRIEFQIQNEIEAVKEELKRQAAGGKAVNLNDIICLAITNIIWTLISGTRLEYDDPIFVEMINVIKEGQEAILSTNFSVIALFPRLTSILPSWLMPSLTTMKHTTSVLLHQIKGIIEHHRASLDSDNPRDYVDHYLLEQMNKAKGTGHSTFTDSQLMVSAHDMLFAGQETTHTTLKWAFLLILKHPEVEKKLLEEMDRVVGRNRPPCLDDQKNMPYTTAVIQEIQRFGDVAPLPPHHTAEKDTIFEGYYIPKGSIVNAYLGYSHRSSKFWSKPFEFYPEHFLLPDGQLRQNVEGFFPFGTGKRACIGDRLAKAELFLFITNILYEFQLRFDPAAEEPSLAADTKCFLIRWPSSYKLIVEPRP